MTSWLRPGPAGQRDRHAREAPFAEIEDARGNRIYKLKRKESGSWVLEDASERIIAKAKPKDDGWELRGADGRTLAKAKPKDGAVRLESEAGQPAGRVGGTTSAEAAAWFALDAFSLSDRAALVVFLLEVKR